MDEDNIVKGISKALRERIVQEINVFDSNHQRRFLQYDYAHITFSWYGKHYTIFNNGELMVWNESTKIYNIRTTINFQDLAMRVNAI